MISKTLQGHSSEKTPSLFHLMIGAMLMHAILFTHTQFLTFLLVRLWQSETVNFDRSLASNVHIFSEWALDSVYIYWYSRSQMSIFVCILTAYTHLWASKHISWLCLDYHLKSIKLMHCNLHIHIKWLGKEYFWRLLRGITLDILHCRHCNPLARRFHGFENTISFWTEHNKQALFASGRDSPSTKQSSSRGDSSSSPDGPPVLTILAGVIVFLLVLWVIGSIFTWIVGLVFGAAKS